MIRRFNQPAHRSLSGSGDVENLLLLQEVTPFSAHPVMRWLVESAITYRMIFFALSFTNSILAPNESMAQAPPLLVNFDIPPAPHYNEPAPPDTTNTRSYTTTFRVSWPLEGTVKYDGLLYAFTASFSYKDSPVPITGWSGGSSEGGHWSSQKTTTTDGEFIADNQKAWIPNGGAILGNSVTLRLPDDYKGSATDYFLLLQSRFVIRGVSR